jgi:hypothetical protein
MKQYLILMVLAWLLVAHAFGQHPDDDRGIGPGTPGNDVQKIFPPEHPSVDKHWEEIWKDEFLNLNNWYSYDHVHDTTRDISVILTKNAYVINGNLVIRAEREDTIFNEKLYNYTNGTVINYSSGMHFGYLEAKIKLPHGKGLWPAFWTLQNTNSPSNEAEIDIFEMLGHLPPNTMTTNLHTCYKDNNTVKKSITIGGNGASNTIANGKNVVMRAKEFIEIKGEFTVSPGASLYLDVDYCE